MIDRFGFMDFTPIKNENAPSADISAGKCDQKEREIISGTVIAENDDVKHKDARDDSAESFEGVIQVYEHGCYIRMAAFQYNTNRYNSVRSQGDPNVVIGVAIMEYDPWIKDGFVRLVFQLYADNWDLRLKPIKIQSRETASEFHNSSISEPKCLAKLGTSYFDREINSHVLQTIGWFRVYIGKNMFLVRSDETPSKFGPVCFRNPFGMRITHPCGANWTTYWMKEIGVSETPMWALMRYDRGSVIVYEFALSDLVDREQWLGWSRSFPPKKAVVV